MTATAEPDGPALEGLRERKRRRTRETIARAALELFDRHGFRTTTLPQIAAAADVSARTVSGYFPTKEALAFPDAEAELERFTVRLRERPPGETATAALRAVVVEQLRQVEERAAEFAARRRVIAANPELRRYERGLLARVEGAIADAIARDLGLTADDLGPRMAAAATLTIFERLGDEEAPSGPAAVAAALDAVDQALRFIDGGIAALRDAAGRDAG